MSHGRAFNILFRQWLSEARYFTLRRSNEARPQIPLIKIPPRAYVGLFWLITLAAVLWSRRTSVLGPLDWIAACCGVAALAVPDWLRLPDWFSALIGLAYFAVTAKVAWIAVFVLPGWLVLLLALAELEWFTWAQSPPGRFHLRAVWPAAILATFVALAYFCRLILAWAFPHASLFASIQHAVAWATIVICFTWVATLVGLLLLKLPGWLLDIASPIWVLWTVLLIRLGTKT
jgi:hypothetical protein